ncbi:hypothetical protein [Oscillatoria sp. HE19RPO]|uniref:hypothetical protein n=1 Tax=Oscillatoria sp. HE19RPO TaxID=2954806 RepID=UPI0020C2A4F2|nr:hypothetical protein [Oscillatoria sp. HE19RPO]
MINTHSVKKNLRNSLPNLAQSLVNNSYLETNFFYPQYQQYLANYQSKLPLLAENDAVIVETLKQQGICTTTLKFLGIPSTNEFIEAVNQLMEELTKISEKRTSKFAIESNLEQLLKYPEIFSWGLEDRLINIVSNYLGTPVAYDTFMAHLSLDNGKETATRRWHLDNEDRKVIKIIIYFNDVDEDGGPFQYMHPEVSSLLLKKAKDKYKFFQNQDIEELIPNHKKDWLTTYTGKAGTVIIVDTARSYHRGKPPTKSPRRAVSFGYLSRRPHQPFRAGRNLLSREELSLIAAKLPQEKQACVYWQDALPPLVKLIPKYSYLY